MVIPDRSNISRASHLHAEVHDAHAANSVAAVVNGPAELHK
jgi:hypothetical protein